MTGNFDSRTGWYPKGLYFAAFKLANEYSTSKRPVSTKEVIITLLRDILIEKYAFTCQHEQERIKEDNEELAHCTYCFTRLKIKKKHQKRLEGSKWVEIEGEYSIIKPFYKHNEKQPKTKLAADSKDSQSDTL